jgi:cold shock CspA family protein
VSAEYLYGTGRKGVPKRAGTPSRHTDPHGVATSGRITKIMVGQGHGFIGLADDREIYFHRSDSKEGTAFSELRVGDAVTFELVEDAVSGARALRVTRKEKRR